MEIKNPLVYRILILALFWSACAQQDTMGDQNNQITDPPPISDEALLDLVQMKTFQYFYDGAESHSSMARERIHMEDTAFDSQLVTTGGTGFGIMAILTAIHRQFISRQEGFMHLEKIVDFLERIPRFHGAWAHWYNGETGEVVPFSPKDDGGDLVETAFLVQGLLCARNYFQGGSTVENELSERMDRLWKSVEWSHYRGPDNAPVLFWHWSPNYGWDINFAIRGYNETLIAYILAASSPTFPVPPKVYHEGWASDGDIVQADSSKPLVLVHQGNEVQGGPLFWAHYSFLGLDPRHLIDRYTNYWEHNVKHVMINRQHCLDNPYTFRGYGPGMWGLTASYSIDFYAAHSPQNDVGVISPTAALASMPYTPEYSMDVLRNLFENHRGNTWGTYGFYDALSVHHDWYPTKYLAIDQGPIVVMIENHRSGMIWELFMASPEIKEGLVKLGFSQ